MTVTTPPPSGTPPVAGPYQPAPKKRRPGCLVAVAAVLVGFAMIVGLANSDREIVAGSNAPSLAGSLAAIWIVSGLALVVIVVAAVRAGSAAMRLVAIALAVPLLAGAIVATVRANQLASSGLIENVQAIQKAAPAACRGTAVAGASPVTTNDLRPLAIVDDEGQPFAWDQVVKQGWAPSSVQDLHTVVCVGPEQQAVRWCNYTGGAKSYSHTTYSREVRVVRAVDAGSVTETVLHGGATPPCEPEIPEKYVHPNEEGSHVGPQDVLSWVTDNLTTTDN